MPNFDGFQSKVETKNGRTTVFLKGRIDETVNLETLLDIPGPLTFNFKGVTAFNSHGMVVWEKFLGKLRHKEILLEHCPTLVVRQMNLVPSFQGHAKIMSVYIAYVCDKCEAEKLVLVDEPHFRGGRPKDVAASFPCESCGKAEMTMDGRLKDYFNFAK